MIRITPQPPPPGFREQVEEQGRAWLDNPENAEKPLPPLWLAFSHALYTSYQGICAYTGTWFSETGMVVKHFLPKKEYRHLAYTWSNYRLTSSRINCRKGTKTELLDPFTVPDEAFHLRLDTGVVSVNEAAFTDPLQLKAAYAVLQILPMNLVSSLHMRYLDAFIHGDISQRKLHAEAPFLYSEMKRQRFL